MNRRERGFLLLTSHLGDPERKVLTVSQLRTLAQNRRVMVTDPGTGHTVPCRRLPEIGVQQILLFQKRKNPLYQLPITAQPEKIGLIQIPLFRGVRHVPHPQSQRP